MLIVTIAALVMAASLGWFAYRLMQEEQRRSDARVALLASALDAAPERGGTWPGPPMVAMRQGPAAAPAPVVRHAPAAVVAAPAPATHNGVPSVVMLDDDSRDMGRFASEVPSGGRGADASQPVLASTVAAPRAAARLADAPLYAPASRGADEEEPTSARRDGLFAEVPDARPGDGRGVIAIAALVLVALLAAGYAWLSSGEAGSVAPTVAGAAPATQTSPASTPAAAPVGGGMPLDLLALEHERRGDTLVVRGVVRNPVAGSTRADLVASVLLLDQAGGFLRSERAALPTAALAPGAQARFAVELPSTSDVRRYRVTFRGADGALVPHADKRQPERVGR